MNAATHAEFGANGFQLFNDRYGTKRDAIDTAGHATLKADAVYFSRLWIAKGLLRQHPGIIGNGVIGSERFLATNGHSPQAAIY